MIQLEREVAIAAPRRRVWEILADHEAMPTWFPAREVVRRRPGSPDPDGVGAIRVVRARGLAVEERVTAFKPDERLEYAVTEGAPVRCCVGEVALSEEDGATRVRWSLRLRPLVPGTGWLLRRLLGRALETGLEGLRHRAQSGPRP